MYEEEELDCFQIKLIYWNIDILGGMQNLDFASSVLSRWYNDKIVKLSWILSERPDMISVCTVEYSGLIHYSVSLRSDVYLFSLIA